MDVYFLRHGLAGQHGDPKYKDDSLRPLTAQGREKIHCAALGMQILGLKFDTVLSSPYLRARQTAEIVAQAYKIKDKNIYFTDNLLPPASIKQLLREVHTYFPKSKNILFVGHEPHLTEMISNLLKSNKPLTIDFKKGGLCKLSIQQLQLLGEPRDAVLSWLLTPAQLCLLAKSKEK
jgi:phosphohistidine phosphatase